MKDINSYYELINEDFEGTFNKDIIVNNRKSEKLIDFIDEVAKSLEILEYIKYDGYELIEDEGMFDVHEICKRPSDNSEHTISQDVSRLSLVKLFYTINYEGEVRKLTMPIFIPKIYRKHYFYINGNKIYPIYQIVDSSTYIMKNTLVLKTTMMPLKIKANIVTLTDIHGEEYSARNFTVSLYKEIPLVSYYFATVGFSKSILYLIGDHILTIYPKDKEIPYTNEETITFPLGENLVLVVDREIFSKQEYVRSVISSIKYVVETFCPSIDYIRVNSITYWRMVLGKMIYTAANKLRGKSLLVLFERVFDNITRNILKIDEDKKKHSYSILKWLTFNFDELMAKDNLSMDNKRLRLSEYMVIPLNSKFSHSIHRLLDYNKRNMTIDTIVSALNVHPMIIIDAMLNSRNKSGISKLTRFCNTVNDMDIIPALKFSLTGPQSIGSGSSNSIPDSHRYLHLSHVGKIDILCSSAGSPGTSGSLLPKGKLYGMNFSDKPEPQTGEELYMSEVVAILHNRELNGGTILESVKKIPTVNISVRKNPSTGHTICARSVSLREEAGIGIDTPFMTDNIGEDEVSSIRVVKNDNALAFVK